MKKVVFTILAVAFSFILNAQTWSVLTTNSTSNLKGIHFPTAAIGYAVGDNGTILKTINGGTNWTSLTTSFPGDWFWDVHFVNADTGYVSGETDPGMNPCGYGIVIKTIDGGASWSTLISGSSSPFRDLFVVDKDTVFICGGAEQTSTIIEKSFNGGATWTTIGTSQVDAIVGGMYFLNSKKGFIGQYIFLNFAYWLNTTDGSTFTSLTVPSSASYWNFASDFSDASHGYFTRSTYSGTDQVYLRKTIDGGSTWNESAIPSFTGSIYGLDFVDSLTGYIVGSVGSGGLTGVVIKTIDGGSTWTAQTIPAVPELPSVYFVNAGLGFAAGANGTILKYSVITGIPETNIAEKPSVIYPNPANGVFQITNLRDNNKIEIFNTEGQLVLSKSMSSANTTLDITSFPSGLYTIVISDNNGISHHKILKR